MIDKDLSNLKKDIPDYNIAEYKKGIFKKYNESKTVYKKESIFPLKYFLSPILIVLIASLTIVFIINNNGNKVNAYEEDRKLLTQLVYNASVQENEEYEVTKISKNKKFSNDLYYTSFTVYESFGFTTKFDFVMEPYINDYIIGEEVFVVIALLEFSNEQFYGDAFLQKMIIFSYKDSLVGFMSPVTSSVLMGDFNEVEKLDDPTVDTLYSFQSASFLTKNAVVKYYEKGDTLYTFEFLEYKNGTIELLIDCNKGECNSNIINNSFVELSEDVVIKLIELTYIEKININVTITGFDEEDKNKIYVESDEISSIESVNYRYTILDENDNILSYDKLNIGDVIEIYYYNRYETYQPKNITVDNVILVDDNNQGNSGCINGEHLWLISNEEDMPLPEYRVYTCFYCGKTKTVNVTIEDPCVNNDHQWDEGSEIEDGNGGYVMKYICKLCGATKEETITIIPPEVKLFYSLQESFDYGFLTHEDIEKIAALFKSNPYNTTGIDTNTQTKIIKDYCEFNNVNYNKGEGSVRSFGEYNGFYAVMVDDTEVGYWIGKSYDTIDGVTITYLSSQKILIWQYRECPHEYSMTENSHQLIMLCDCCETPAVEEFHFDKDNDYLCDVCGYVLYRLFMNGEYIAKSIASYNGLIMNIDSLKIEENILYLNYLDTLERKIGKFETSSKPGMKLSNIYDIDKFSYKTEEAKDIVKELFNNEFYYTIIVAAIPESAPGYILMYLNNKLYYIETLSQTSTGNSVIVYELIRKYTANLS